MGNMSPCLGCKERHALCWDDCPKYLAFKQIGQAIKDARTEYMHANDIAVESVTRQRKRY